MSPLDNTDFANRSLLGMCAWFKAVDLDAPLPPTHPAYLSESKLDALQSGPILRAVAGEFEAIFGRAP